jgi:polyketide synthase PksN
MSDSAPLQGNEVAIVGMAGRFPGARSLAEFWHNLEQGVESIRRLSDEELRAAGVPEHLLADPHYGNSDQAGIAGRVDILRGSGRR